MTTADVKKYLVKMNDRFNLDSMREYLRCIIYDMEDGNLPSKINIMGKIMTIDDVRDFKDECEELELKCAYAVTGKEWARIREISEARQLIRYATCLANGMSERDARYAFN